MVTVLLGLPGANALQRRLSATDGDIAAPHLIDAEVIHAVRRYVSAGHASAERGAQATDDFTDLQLQRYPHVDLLDRVWTLRANLSAYDAIYVALAETLDVPLITADKRIAHAPGHRARVEVV